ncbi:MAG: hypothetical protein V4450_08660 [Bacteroidota bacterium]
MTSKQMRVLALLMILPFFLQAQVQFSKLSFQSALDRARTENKMVLLVLESVECVQCNEVAVQGLANASIGQSFNNSCISLQVNASYPDFALLDSLYTIANSFGLLFIDADKNLLHRYASSTTFVKMYQDQLNIALNKKEHPDLAFKQFQEDYNNGKRDFDLLYQLVAKKNAAAQEHDLLTEEMLNLAPKDSALSLSFLQFLAEQAPVYDSKVYVFMHSNNQNFNDAWYLMPLSKRASINGKMTAKSKKKAISEKNAVYAERVASLAAGTYSDRVQARRNHDYTMLDYYKGVKDTSSFLLGSVKYYDQYLMNISVDSVKRVDSIRRAELLANTVPSNITTPSGKTIFGTSIQYAPTTQYYTRELNNGAWTLYTSTHDPFYMQKALGWIKRANEFYEDPGALDTYARLLYRTGDKTEAIRWQEKAIEITKSRRMPSGSFDEILSKMKTGDTVIDKY